MLLAAVAAGAVLPLWSEVFEGIDADDPIPAESGLGRIEWRGPHMVLHVGGTAEEMGRDHGTLLENTIGVMLDRYIYRGRVISRYETNEARVEVLDGVKEMKGALPPWFVKEVEACAAAAGVDPDVLLLAQCEGDLLATLRPPVPAGRAEEGAAAQSCSAYAVFGRATSTGGLVAARNFDYRGTDVARKCALVTYYRPREGLRFAAVGWSGILTGWTLINERGLVVANHIGGGKARRLQGVPTLVLTRMIAQHAATIDEGIEIIRNTPRMRGQIVWMAQDADAASGRAARAVAVEYDAEHVAVREAEEGVLIVTNTNRAIGAPRTDAEVVCGRYRALRSAIDEAYGRLDGSESLTALPGVLLGTTLHIVQAAPSEGRFEVRHGRVPADGGTSVVYELPGSEGLGPQSPPSTPSR